MSDTGVPNIDQILKAGFDFGNTGTPVRRKPNRRKAIAPKETPQGDDPQRRSGAGDRSTDRIQPWRAFIRGFFLLMT